MIFVLKILKVSNCLNSKNVLLNSIIFINWKFNFQSKHISKSSHFKIQRIFFKKIQNLFVCHKLKLISVFLSRFKKIFNFEKIKIKSIIHQILFKMTIQNYSKIFVSLFIIKIKQHSLILKKFWMNKHEMIFNMINDECYFISNHYDHVEFFFVITFVYILEII